jgi:hypothetical protein
MRVGRRTPWGRRTQTSNGGNRGRCGEAARQTLWGFGGCECEHNFCDMARTLRMGKNAFRRSCGIASDRLYRLRALCEETFYVRFDFRNEPAKVRRPRHDRTRAGARGATQHFTHNMMMKSLGLLQAQTDSWRGSAFRTISRAATRAENRYERLACVAADSAVSLHNAQIGGASFAFRPFLALRSLLALRPLGALCTLSALRARNTLDPLRALGT